MQRPFLIIYLNLFHPQFFSGRYSNLTASTGTTGGKQFRQMCFRATLLTKTLAGNACNDKHSAFQQSPLAAGLETELDRVRDDAAQFADLDFQRLDAAASGVLQA